MTRTEAATKHDLGLLDAKLTSIIEVVQARVNRLDEKLSGRVDDLQNGMGKLSGELELLDGKVDTLDDKMDRILDRLGPPVRWMLGFGHAGGRCQTEVDFPQFDFWHDDPKSAEQEAYRVLGILKDERNDERSWYASMYPDPFEVGSGRHLGGGRIIR